LGAQSLSGPSRIVDSSDGIDPDFLAALPPDLRLEVKRDYALAKAQPSGPAGRQSVERAATESPTKIQTKHAAAHITRQLRPKVKTQMKATAVAETPLYGAWAKAADEPVDLTVDEDEEIGGYTMSELRDLGIDPDVFGALPNDMRREIITEERKKRRQRKMLHRPADTSRLRAKTRDDTRTVSLSPSRAGSVPAQSRPLVAVSLPPRPALLKASSLSDVQETITRWIDSRKGGPPAEKDAGKVQAYLVKCFDGDMGVSAAENAVEALKWMRLELRDRWPEMESSAAGRVWWDTWRRFVEAVDASSIERFGAPVRL
jgi:DNA repair protein REV1